MGRGKGDAGSCEESTHRWQNLLWSRNDHSWGEPKPHSHTCVTNIKRLNETPDFQKWGAPPSTTKINSSGRYRYSLQKVSQPSPLLRIFLSPLNEGIHTLNVLLQDFQKVITSSAGQNILALPFFPLKNQIWLKFWNTLFWKYHIDSVKKMTTTPNSVILFWYFQNKAFIFTGIKGCFVFKLTLI